MDVFFVLLGFIGGVMVGYGLKGLGQAWRNDPPPRKPPSAGSHPIQLPPDPPCF